MKQLLSILILIVPTLIWAQIDRSVRPAPGKAPQINIKDSEVFTTANGITVILSENHKVPKVSFDLVMGADPQLEGSKAGLSDLAGSLIMSGTSNRDKDALDNEIDYIGARIAADKNSIYLSCLTKHMDKGLTLMSDILMNANFPESEFERIVKQNESGLKSTQASPGAMAANALSKSTYPATHPYSEVMTEATLNNITRADVIEFFKRNFTPKGSYLVVVGDIDRATTEKMVNQYFGSWNGGMAFKNPSLKNKELNGNQVYFVKKPGAVQSVIYVAFPVDIRPGSPDQIGVTVLNNILGGGAFGNRLMQNLREDKAYTYGCRSAIDIDEHGSLFTASGNFRNDVSDSAITEILAEIERITNGYVTDEELNLTKSSMAGGFARALENPQTVARFARNIKKYNLPKDYYQTYLKKLEAINKEDILTMAQKYFNPKNLNIIVVGNEEILERLMPFDSDQKIEMLDAFGNEAKETKPSDITADQLIERYVLAMTNASTMKTAAKTLKKVKTVTTITELTSAQVPIPLKMTQIWSAPNKEGMKLEGQGMTLQRSFFDGEKGGSSSMQAGKETLTDEEISAKQKTQGLIPEMNYKTSGMTYEMVGIEEVNGKDAYVLKTNDGQKESFDYYDKTTLMKVKTVSTQEREGESVTSEMTYGDYEPINGVMFAKTMSMSVGPLSFDGKISSITVNEKVDLAPYSN